MQLFHVKLHSPEIAELEDGCCQKYSGRDSLPELQGAENSDETTKKKWRQLLARLVEAGERVRLPGGGQKPGRIIHLWI